MKTCGRIAGSLFSSDESDRHQWQQARRSRLSMERLNCGLSAIAHLGVSADDAEWSLLQLSCATPKLPPGMPKPLCTIAVEND